MRVLRISLFLFLSCFAAKAQDQNIHEQNILEQNRGQDMQVGRGVMCDTLDQLKRFVALRSDGKAPELALLAVNSEARNAEACNLGIVQFSAAEPLATMAVMGREVTIVRITVHAFGNGTAWKQVPETVQYMAVPEQGRMAGLDGSVAHGA